MLWCAAGWRISSLCGTRRLVITNTIVCRWAIYLCRVQSFFRMCPGAEVFTQCLHGSHRSHFTAVIRWILSVDTDCCCTCSPWGCTSITTVEQGKIPLGRRSRRFYKFMTLSTWRLDRPQAPIRDAESSFLGEPFVFQDSTLLYELCWLVFFVTNCVGMPS